MASKASKVNMYQGKVNIQDYEFVRKLGQGGFGRVLFAKKLEDQEHYAVKVFAKDTLMKEKLVNCIKLEKTLMAELDHPFIVNLIGYSKDTKFSYLIMECATGGDLYTHLRHATDRRFPSEWAKFYCAQLVLTLAHLQKKNIIHRDLKPDNVLLCHNGYTKLCDFGLAKKIQSGGAYTFCGTPNYMAPEILRNKRQSVAVDWWSLGVVMYQMLTGSTPWNAKEEKDLYEKIIDGTIFFPSLIEKDAKSLLKRLCTADLSMRFGDLKDGSADVQNHKWFNDINFEDLLTKAMKPPFTPTVSNATDTSNSDTDSGSECFGGMLGDAPSVTSSQDPFGDW